MIKTRKDARNEVAEKVILELLTEYKDIRPNGLGYVEILSLAIEREGVITGDDAWRAVNRLVEKGMVARTMISVCLVQT